MTPLTKTVVISQPSATESLLVGSRVYQPLATKSLPGVSHFYQASATQNSFGFLNSFGFSKIQELVQNLSNLDGVEAVKAVPQNLHSVVFQIKLSALPEYESFDDDLEFEYEIESNNVDKVWDVAQDLVLKTCCHLRDITGEKWYFFTQIVEDFTNPLLDS